MKKGRATRRKEQKGPKRQAGGSQQSDLIVSKFPDAMAPTTAAAAAAADCSIKGYQTPTMVHGAPLSMAYKPVMPQVPESAVAVAASYPAFPQGQPAQMASQSTQSTQSIQSTQSGAGKPTKVVLQSKSKTVHLTPKGATPSAASASATSAASASASASVASVASDSTTASATLAKKGHATKRSRRITLGLQALKKRQTRAQKIQVEVKDMPIAKVREHLIAKKLIKPTSKAPEKVLRQMAVDAHIVAGKGL